MNRLRARPLFSSHLLLRRAYRSAICVCLLAGGAAIAPLAAEGQEAAGRWVLAVELDAGSGDATFVFTVEDGVISGTYSGTLGEQAVQGTVDGAEVTFSFEQDQVGTVRYVGTIEGDSMAGTCEYGMLGGGTFSGTRREG